MLSVSPTTRDPGDDYLIALAHAGSAVLVSGDHDLTEAGISEPPVLRPRQLTEQLER